MKVLQPVLWAALCIVVGMLAGVLQGDSLKEWYPHLNKAPLTPPDWVFPVVWTILYVLMGISIGLARQGGHPRRGAVTGLFLAQLALNFLWSIGFFCLRSPAAGLWIIGALLLLLLLYVRESFAVSRTSSYLFVPYILWVGFACYLNVYIFLYN